MLVAKDIVLEFSNGIVVNRAIDGVNCSFNEGSFTAVMGPSGSGKSTLLYCLAGLLRPTEGTIHFDELEIGSAPEAVLTKLRRDQFGFVFQDFNLIPALNAEQNIALPSLFGARKVSNREAVEALEKVGLGGREKAYPSELSGGQQQRVAVARALAQRRQMVFADEPTGALDRNSGAAVISHFRSLCDEGTTLIMVTHDPIVASAADRVLFLVDGKLVHHINHPTAQQVSDQVLGLETRARS